MSTARGRVRPGRFAVPRGLGCLPLRRRVGVDRKRTSRPAGAFRVRLAGQGGVQRLEAPGRTDQQPGRLGGASLVEGDLPAQVRFPPPRPAARPLVRPPITTSSPSAASRPHRPPSLSPGRGQQPTRYALATGLREVAAPLLPRNAAAAARPPRSCARTADRSRSAATSSSGSGAAWARCQARRSGSAAGSVASASAAWTLLPHLRRRRPVGCRPRQRMPEPLHAHARYCTSPAPHHAAPPPQPRIPSCPAARHTSSGSPE